MTNHKFSFTKTIGKIMIMIGLILVAIRSFSIDFFDQEVSKQTLISPSGYIMARNKLVFSFGVAGDSGAINAPIERIIKNIREKDAHFMLYLGDLVRYRNPSHFKWMVDEVKVKLKGMPFYAVPGNHEIIAEDGELDNTLYTAIFGLPYYWFSYGNTLFIGLDTSDERLSSEQVKWLNAILSSLRHKYQYCIIFTHVPPINPRGEDQKTLDSRSRGLLAKAIEGKNIDLILAGHVHYFSRSEFEGVPLVTVPASGQEARDETNDEPGYLFVTISGKGLQVHEHFIPKQKNNDTLEMWLSGVVVRDNINTASSILIIVGLLLLVFSWKFERD